MTESLYLEDAYQTEATAAVVFDRLDIECSCWPHYRSFIARLAATHGVKNGLVEDKIGLTALGFTRFHNSLSCFRTGAYLDGRVRWMTLSRRDLSPRSPMRYFWLYPVSSVITPRIVCLPPLVAW